ncbi:hypothetical protein BJI67_12960 [Acidihalobacter aeolianus]|uniref:Uncharacterized protein n=1 Tax=Acidihalobacter aeolianus TaxID=2792603 RepID=A0A1D8KA47_9GAMM|nr:hypothetical protein [Acidihalobacter aeolianus]AOV17842.1 hypothetical protein BJI67_12960 [Acidihalobacter aeolianus]
MDPQQIKSQVLNIHHHDTLTAWETKAAWIEQRLKHPNSPEERQQAEKELEALQAKVQQVIDLLNRLGSD